MSGADDTPPDDPSDAVAQLRHDLKTPLTVAHARAQLVTRMVRRSPSLTEVERGPMLASLAAIDLALRAMLPVIDSIGRPRPEDQQGD